MDKRNLSDRYTDLRIEKGLSQTELATALDCNKQYISKFEDGSRSLSLAMLEKYADFFGVSTDYLLGRSDVKTTDSTVKGMCEYTGLSESAIDTILQYKKVASVSVWLKTLNALLENESFISLISMISQKISIEEKEIDLNEMGLHSIAKNTDIIDYNMANLLKSLTDELKESTPYLNTHRGNLKKTFEPLFGKQEG